MQLLLNQSDHGRDTFLAAAKNSSDPQLKAFAAGLWTAEDADLYVDAEGAPTSAPHICPDSALNVLADFDLPVVLAPQTLLQVSAQIGLSALALPDHPAVVPPSRGPPLSI